MNRNDQQNRSAELEELLGRALLGDAEASELERLNAMIREDPEAQHEAAQWLIEDACLRRELKMMGEVDQILNAQKGDSRVEFPERRRLGTPFVRRALGWAAVLALMGIVVFSFVKRDSPVVADATEKAHPLLNGDEVIARYDFEQDIERPWILRDQRKEVVENRVDGEIAGCRWGEGFLRFNELGDAVTVELPEAYGSLSKLVWLRVDRCDFDENAIVASDQHQWQFLPDGSLKVALGEAYDITSEPGDLSFGEWAHVAAVIDTKAGRAQYYVNGVEVLSTEFESVEALKPGQMTIGGLETVDDTGLAEIDCGFRGDMGEFVMLARAVTPEEIKRAYQMGREHS